MQVRNKQNDINYVKLHGCKSSMKFYGRHSIAPQTQALDIMEYLSEYCKSEHEWQEICSHWDPYTVTLANTVREQCKIIKVLIWFNNAVIRSDEDRRNRIKFIVNVLMDGRFDYITDPLICALWEIIYSGTDMPKRLVLLRSVTLHLMSHNFSSFFLPFLWYKHNDLTPESAFSHEDLWQCLRTADFYGFSRALPHAFKQVDMRPFSFENGKVIF